MSQRAELLQILIRFELPIADIVQSLKSFGWDSNKILVSLNRSKIISVLNRYVKSELSSASIEEWANAIEGREDIGYEAQYENIIRSAIHELANPLLTQPLSAQSAKQLISNLSKNIR